MRWGLCDQPPGIDQDDTPNYHVRRSRLIDQTLKPLTASVEIRFQVNGVPHVVRRSSDTGAIRIKIADDEMRPGTESEIRSLLPIQAYSQKQLSDVSVRMDELSRFITVPIGAELDEIDRRLGDRADRVRETHAVRQRQKALAATVQKRQLEAKSLVEQAEKLRSSLTGLSDEDRRLLAMGRSYDIADHAVQSWLSVAQAIERNASEFRRSVDRYETQAAEPPSAPEPDLLKQGYDELRRLLSEVRKGLDAISAKAHGIVAPSAEDTVWGVWGAKLGAFRRDYEAAVQRSSVHSERMQQLKAVEGRLAGHERETAQLQEQLTGLRDAEADYRAELSAWRALLTERDDLIDQQCLGLTQNSDGAIRARVQRGADASDFVERLRSSLAWFGCPTREDRAARTGSYRSG
jgi:chromosome segregation protein